MNKKMNKKAAGIWMPSFLLLISVAIIATAFFIFYTWYGIAEQGISFKIDEKAADFKETQVLINLLNTPVDKHTTILDLIITNDPKAVLKIHETMIFIYKPLKIKYILTMDGNLVAKTKDTPQAPLEQEVTVPVPFKKPKKIKLEFGL